MKENTAGWQTDSSLDAEPLNGASTENQTHDQALPARRPLPLATCSSRAWPSLPIHVVAGRDDRFFSGVIAGHIRPDDLPTS